jgi:hypothetical protein
MTQRSSLDRIRHSGEPLSVISGRPFLRQKKLG